MRHSNACVMLTTLAFTLLSASNVLAQTQQEGPFSSAPPSPTTSSPLSTITPAASISSATITQGPSDVPQSLWGIANSLLSSYYPSSSITQVYSLTWPTAVVIDSSTYSVHPASSATAAPESTQPPAHKLRTDEKLGIGIGVAVGFVALIVLGLVLCCLHRRRKTTGAYFRRRATPSVASSDVEAWRSPNMREVARWEPEPSREWAEKYSNMSHSAPAPVQPPPMALHPAFARQHTHWSSNSSSDENPFYTPGESPNNFEMSGANNSSSALASKEVDGFEPVPRRSSDSIQRESRPPTPFSPMLMMGGGAAAARRSEERGRQNPFESPEDDEADDIVSPILPARSPERRYSPLVHYPSWSEVSEFDFSGDGRARNVRGQPSYEEGGDGWRPARDSVYGRHELA